MVKDNVIKFVSERLKQQEDVEKIFVEQKSNEVFEVVVITKKINPVFEKKLIELEDVVQQKFRVPSYFKTFSSASAAAALLTQ